MSIVMDYLMQPINLFFDLSKLDYVYDTLYEVALLRFLRENITAVSVFLYLVWYAKVYTSRTNLIVKEGDLMHRIVEKIACIHTGYRPTFWCVPSALNTVVFALIQRCIKHHYYREVLKTPDGGLIAIDWANLGAPNKVILLVLPGLTGSSKENYVTHLADEAVQAGCTAVVMNYRGIEVELTTPRTYCATNYDDLHMVVNHIHNKYPEHKILAIGVSLGGIKLGGYLAKQYDDCLLSNAMIVSAPLNVFYSCEELEKTQYFFTFNRHLANQIGKYFNKYKHFFQTDEKYDCTAIAKCQTLRQFDTEFVSKQFGYKSCEEYYQDACLDAKIQNIRVPTIFLNAGDDMFSPERAFPIDKIKSNPFTAMVWTKYGGHISFCEGILPISCNYSCRLLKEYLNVVLTEQIEEEKKKPADSSNSSSNQSDSESRAKFTLE